MNNVLCVKGYTKLYLILILQFYGSEIVSLFLDNQKIKSWEYLR